jgi:hypothetical protein
VIRPCEGGQEILQHALEAVLRFDAAQLCRGRLPADDEFDFGDHLGEHAAVAAQRLRQRIAPGGELRFGLGEPLKHQCAKRLDQGAERHAARDLVELARDEVPMATHDRSQQLLDQRGLAGACRALDEHQLAAVRPARTCAFERRQQHLCLVLATVEY